MSNRETEQLVASAFRYFKSEAKRERAGRNADVEKIVRAVDRRIAREREAARFWATVDRVHELARRGADDAEQVRRGWE